MGSSVEERVAFLEGRATEQAQVIESVRQGFADLNARFQEVSQRFDAVDRRFEAIDRRFEAIDRRFEAVDQRFQTLEAKMSRQFVWIVGIQTTTFVATLAAILGVVLAR